MSLEALPHWDLSNVYPGLDSDEFARQQADLQQEMLGLQAEVDRLVALDTTTTPAADLAQALSSVIERLNAILLQGNTQHAYLYSFTSTDTFNQEARRKMSQFEQQIVQLQQQDTRLRAAVGRLADRLPEILAQPGSASEHAFFLQETARLSRYMMSEAEETLASELALSGAGAWSKLHRTVTSQLSAEIELDGQRQTLPVTAIINLRSHPDEAIRRNGYETENRLWDTVREPLAAAINGVKGSAIVLNRRRGRGDALEVALDDARMDRETLDAMLSAMRDSFPRFRQYFQAKARRLGKPALAWWDLFAPLGKVESSFTWDGARDFILERFGQFSPDLARIAATAFERNWIDAEPRKGKVAGAFCMGVPAVQESRVLANFDGSLDQVFTIAHELGHGFHNHCQFQAGKTELRRSNPRTLAETASIMCETIVLNAALDAATNRQEELAILETSLISDAQVIVDIYSRFLFEKEVFERREQAELSADELCEIMARAQKATYGEGLDEQFLQPYMWTWKPHYYMPGAPFYNFPYAFGLLFGIGLYAVYRQRGPAFVADYKALLASTGDTQPAELAARFGIDLRTPAFWQSSLNVIGDRIQRYLTIE